jgi:signal transduction histidine kinase
MWLDTWLVPLTNETGEVIAVLGVSRDLTDRKKTEELLLENERLVLASKAISEFLATMSHELRTPLNSIIGFSELLKQKTAGEVGEKQAR